jgi:hypothetical protein
MGVRPKVASGLIATVRENCLERRGRGDEQALVLFPSCRTCRLLLYAELYYFI